MGTRSYIAKQIGDDEYLSIFCQLDGYPEEMGKKLLTSYASAEQVDALLTLGDIYSLGAKLYPNPSNPHDIEHGWQKDVTVAFGRDRDEHGFESTIRDLDELIDNDEWAQYVYIFAQDGHWKFIDTDAVEMEVRDVAEALENTSQNTEDASNEEYGWLKSALRRYLRQPDAKKNTDEGFQLQL